MKIVPVQTVKEIRAFHRLPFKIYSHNLNWIAPLRQDIEKIFRSETNIRLHGDNAIRFLLYTDTGEIAGRIAAFIQYPFDNTLLKVGSIGFFECVNDLSAAEKLFDASRNWLEQRGCNVMEGPVNFGERDRWWGLLVQGFDPPVYGMNYHLPYYKTLFESYGFQNYFEQYTFLLHRDRPMPKIVYEIKERLELRNNVSFQTADKNDMQRFARDFRIIYNKAWAHHDQVPEMTEAQSRKIMQEVKPIMDPSLMIFAYVKNEPAGFFIGLPDANQLLKYAKGNLNLTGVAKILIRKPFIQMKHIYGIIFGVVPEHQNKGIEAGMAAKMHEMVNRSRYYEQIELLWIGDFNKKMLNFVRHIQAEPYRTLITYRKNLDATLPFERCPPIE